MHDAQRRLTLLKGLLAFSIVSTTAHFTHNFVAIDQYPDDLVSGAVTQVGILLSWPLLTAIGLLGYRYYAHGDYRHAHPCLIAYSFLGISTLGHFLDAVPDIAPLWFATIFTDAIAGFLILAFTVRSMRIVRMA